MNQVHTAGRFGTAWTLLLSLAGTSVALPGHAEVGLRVESHPITAPIDAYVRVMDGSEVANGLTPADFAVTLDGAPVGFSLTLPPNQDSTQKVSVVIVMNNHEGFRPHNFSPLIEQLAIGDLVSVVKFGGDMFNSRRGGIWVLPFTEIDDGPGSERIQRFIRRHPELNESGGPKFLFDGLLEAISQMAAASPTLPDGPKAIVTVDCCGGRPSLSDVIAGANAVGVPIFNDLGGSSEDYAAEHKSLAQSTGGIQVRTRNVQARMASWLRDGYRVTIPHTAIGDCNWHRLGITVGGESKSVTFSRCDSTPEEFDFRYLVDAEVSTPVRARAVITGIETSVPVRVVGGQYSVGCTSEFTRQPGRIRPGQSVCVRHITAATGGLEVSTLLIVGGVSEWFTSSTAFP